MVKGTLLLKLPLNENSITNYVVLKVGIELLLHNYCYYSFFQNLHYEAIVYHNWFRKNVLVGTNRTPMSFLSLKMSLLGNYYNFLKQHIHLSLPKITSFEWGQMT